MAGKIVELFSRVFEHPIWQTSLDQNMTFLLLQTRDEDSHTAPFHVVDLDHGDVRAEIDFEESWWMRCEVFQWPKAWISVTIDEQNPESKNLFLWDFELSSTLASFSECKIMGLSNTGVSIFTEGELKHYDDGGKVISNVKISDAPLMMDIQSAGLIMDDQEDFQLIKEMVTSVNGHDAKLGAEYIEALNKIFISYNVVVKTRIDNHLLVLDLDGEPLINQKINENAKGIGRDTFLIFGQKLMFISHRRTIWVYEV